MVLWDDDVDPFEFITQFSCQLFICIDYFLSYTVFWRCYAPTSSLNSLILSSETFTLLVRLSFCLSSFSVLSFLFEVSSFLLSYPLDSYWLSVSCFLLSSLNILNISSLKSSIERLNSWLIQVGLQSYHLCSYVWWDPVLSHSYFCTLFIMHYGVAQRLEEMCGCRIEWSSLLPSSQVTDLGEKWYFWIYRQILLPLCVWKEDLSEIQWTYIYSYNWWGIDIQLLKNHFLK